MHIKKMLVVLALVAIMLAMFVMPVLAQSATPPVASTATAPLTVPGVLATAVAVFVGFLVTQGLKALSQMLAKYKWLSWIDMSGWGSWITSFVVSGLLFYANMALGFIPAAYTPVATMVLTFVAQVLSTNGLHYVIQGSPTPMLTSTLLTTTPTK